jgi:hypothetical protein
MDCIIGRTVWRATSDERQGLVARGITAWKVLAMGLYDTVEVLDEPVALRCAHGHALRSFQTKDLDEPSMSSYFVHGGRLYLAFARDNRTGVEHVERWRIEGDEAVQEHRFGLREIAPPRVVRIYGQCYECPPVLVRTDAATLLGDIVREHALFVDFALTFRSGEPVQIERTSGTRDELKNELRARGVYVLEDDEPLAVAHGELKKARELSAERGSRRRGGSW